jgi:hypothetical protein
MTDEIKKEEIVSEAPKGSDAPKAGSTKAEPMQKAGDYEDLGPAVVRPTDKNPDGTKKAKKDTSAPTKGAGAAEKPEKVKEQANGDEPEDDKEKEDEKPAEKEVDETPKTKSGMIQAIYDNLGKMRKSDVSSKYSKLMAAMNGDEEEPEDEKPEDEKDAEAAAASEKKEAVDKRVKDIDVKEDVKALVDGDESLSEEFKSKAATIFEAAVKSKVKSEIERLEDEYKTEITEAKEDLKKTLTDKVDNYLNYVVEEWMKENELAIEKGIKGEIAEDFIGGLKQLFEDHYIDVPDEKYDILDSKEKEVEELKGKINEMTKKEIESKKVINDFTKEEILDDVTSSLADTEVEKLKSLVENISYEGAEDYKSKVEVIKNSYFGDGSKVAPESTENVDTINTNNSNTVSDLSNSMSRYTDAISRVKGRDIYNN